ncbi:MAG TPA: hypothetical protein VFI25_05515 [Planctomycetota bacterium]|nr:hypothetical protein [Planctomycetota bacterium]
MPKTRRVLRQKARRRRDPDAVVCAQIARNAGKYVAINREWTRVVAVGRTLMEAHRRAIEAGFADAPIFRARRDYSGIFY